MAATFQQFLGRVATRQRTVVLGGLAVIAHGLSRPTKDGDAWLDPLDSPERWAETLLATVAEFERGLSFWSLAERRNFAPDELAAMIAIDGVVRLTGLLADLDLFRKPNGLEITDFDTVWQQSEPWAEAVRVIDPVNLILSKENTGREIDQRDISYLESVIRADLGGRLAVASLGEARGILARYCDYVVCERALANPDPGVRTLARERLTEMAEHGDWFSRDVLARSEGG